MDSVLCEVENCGKRHKNAYRAKRQHFELFHRTECEQKGWNYQAAIACNLPLNQCHLCAKLVEGGKPRYSLKKPYCLKRHKARAFVKSGLTERIKCRVVDLVTRSDGRSHEVSCTRSFADQDSLRRHLCGADGVSTERAHDIKSLKKVFIPRRGM